MSYTINPDTLSSLLYPVSYRSLEPSAVIQQQVDVYVGGSLAGSFLAAQTGTSGSSAVFDTNIQSFLYSDVAPLTGAKTSFFGTLDTYSLTNNTDVIKSVFCVSKNQTVSSAGFLVTSTASQNSSTGFVIPSQFYGDENNFNLSDFYQPSANPFRFLTTNNQDRRCNDDGNIFLSFVGKGVTLEGFYFTLNQAQARKRLLTLLFPQLTMTYIHCRLVRLTSLEAVLFFTWVIFLSHQVLMIIIRYPLVHTTEVIRSVLKVSIFFWSQIVMITFTCIGSGNTAVQKVISSVD